MSIDNDNIVRDDNYARSLADRLKARFKTLDDRISLAKSWIDSMGVNVAFVCGDFAYERVKSEWCFTYKGMKVSAGPIDTKAAFVANMEQIKAAYIDAAEALLKKLGEHP